MIKSEVFNMDCIQGMKQYPDKYFELAIVDPPYGIGFDREISSMSAALRVDGTKRKMKTWANPKIKNYTKKNWDNDIPNTLYFDELKRVSKNYIIWGANYMTDFLNPHGGWIVWDKCVPENMSLSKCELAYNTCLNSISLIKLLWAGYKKCENVSRIHPTQKPVKLYKWLLTNYANKGDKILDTHLGSGSSRIAAYDLGFDFTGYELDKEYFEAQEKRFNNFKAQLKLF